MSLRERGYVVEGNDLLKFTQPLSVGANKEFRDWQKNKPHTPFPKSYIDHHKSVATKSLKILANRYKFKILKTKMEDVHAMLVLKAEIRTKDGKKMSLRWSDRGDFGQWMTKDSNSVTWHDARKSDLISESILTATLSDDELLRMMARAGHVTANKLAMVTRMDLGKVKQMLTKLVRKGKIKTDKREYWTIKP